MKPYAAPAFVMILSLVLRVNAQADLPVGLGKGEERLSVAEAKAIRHAVTSQGFATASVSLERPFCRILIVPNEIMAAYAKKPMATVRLLLRIIDGGAPPASIHASACINALVQGPEWGWMATHEDNETWDDLIADREETHREFAYNTCVRIITEKESNRALEINK
jgi:hypothetical protein